MKRLFGQGFPRRVTAHAVWAMWLVLLPTVVVVAVVQASIPPPASEAARLAPRPIEALLSRLAITPATPDLSLSVPAIKLPVASASGRAGRPSTPTETAPAGIFASPVSVLARAPADGTYTLFSGLDVPLGNREVYVGVDYTNNGHLDIDGSAIQGLVYQASATGGGGTKPGDPPPITPTYVLLTVTKFGAGQVSVPAGIACSTCGNGVLLPQGTTVTLTAIPDAGSLLASWSGCDMTANNTCTLTLNSDRTVSLTFGTPNGFVNDTAITTCGDGANNNLTCPQSGYPGQDAENGRDAKALAGTLTKTGEGKAGFDFIKIDNNGNSLSASASSWSCIRDNVTGLLWENKTDDGGLHDKDWTYAWYNADPNTNGSDVGSPGSNTCGGTLSGFSNQCNTANFVAAVNTQGLCSYQDWRMPTKEELLSILDYSTAYPGPAIDTTYFSNTNNSLFWSASPYAGAAGSAHYVSFYKGDFTYIGKSYAANARLVRGGR